MVKVLLALLLGAGGNPPEGAPGGVREGERRERWGLEVFALCTDFDEGLKIEKAWGLGADLKLGLEGDPRMSLRLGYAGWNTENDEDELPAGGVWGRQ